MHLVKFWGLKLPHLTLSPPMAGDIIDWRYFAWRYIAGDIIDWRYFAGDISSVNHFFCQVYFLITLRKNKSIFLS